MSWLDLHLHSSFSDDGEFSPTRLALLCWRAGIGTAALADHKMCIRDRCRRRRIP